MDLKSVIERISKLLNKFTGRIKSFPQVISGDKAGVTQESIPRRKKPVFPGNPENIWTRLTGKTDDLADRLFGRFPEDKRRAMLFSAGGLTALLLILAVTILAGSLGRPEKSVTPDISKGPEIPSGELFFPGEPDFVPEYLLEREPRRSWSLEDIRPYWKAPADSGVWRDEIKSGVDKLMEAVP